MTIHVMCDICKRSCQDYTTVEATGDTGDGPSQPIVLHICHARSGGDVGCQPFFSMGIKHAKEVAENALREREPYLFQSDGTRKAYL